MSAPALNWLAKILKSSQLFFVNDGGQVGWALSAQPWGLLSPQPFSTVAGVGEALQVKLPHLAAFVARSDLLFQVRFTATEKSPRCRLFSPAASGPTFPPTPDALFSLRNMSEALPCVGGRVGGWILRPPRTNFQNSTCPHPEATTASTATM